MLVALVTRSRPASRLLATAAVCLSLGAATGCRGKDISFDCENQRGRFDERAFEEELPLAAEVPAKGPWPVAMQLTEDGVNKLLASIIDEDVPFSGSVPFGVLPQGPADAMFSPTSAPELRLDAVKGCKTCVVFHLDFGVQLSSPEMDLSSGAGFVDLNIPLRIETAAGVSRVVADYNEATIGDWYLSVFGFDSETHTMLAGALKLLMAEQIAANYGEVVLLEVGTWQVGQGAVDLQMRGLEIFTDEGNRKLVLGMHTNLPLGKGVGLDVSQPLPNGSVLAVSMDPGLLLPMAHQMLAEGEIARVYDDEGNPDPHGIYGVTLENIDANAQGNESLDSTFRVWRVGEGYCGYAEAVMPLNLGVETTGTITVTPGSAQLVAGEGSGAAALQEKKLVDENQHLIDTFRADLAAQLADTLNFSALDIEGSSVVFTNEGIDLTVDEMRTYLNFTVYADE